MIIITGAAGFIGSNMVSQLNEKGFYDLILVDDFSDPEKNKNIENKQYTERIHRDEFINWIAAHHRFIQIIIHLGARTDTSEFDESVFERLNLNYSKEIWKKCAEYGLPLIYASSAATYGLGENGYNDDHNIVDHLSPLNPYGKSKNEFDQWALRQEKQPYFWAGLKFFNVYGPNEYHKGRMASVIYHAFNQIHESGKMKLFRSHRPDIKDGEQARDFVYIKDVTDVIYFLMHQRSYSGLFNMGTGKARTFYDLVKNVFEAMDMPENIEFIDTPEDIRDKYQYFTQANMQKLRSINYNQTFTSLEEGVDDYVTNYLQKNAYR